MTEPKQITVKWIGGSSLPNPTVSPHELFDASMQFMEYLRGAGYNEATVLSTWKTWLQAAERISIEAIRHAVPSEHPEDVVREVEDDD